MKSLRFMVPLLVLALTLAFLPACAAEAPEVAEEPEPIEEPEVAEEPEPPEEPPVEEPEEPEVAEEPEEAVLEEEAELLWVYEHEDLDSRLQCVAVSPDEETLVAGAYLTTYTHLLYDGALMDVDASHRHSVDDIDFSPDGSMLGIGLTVYGVSLIDAESGEEIIQLHGGYDNRLAFSPDGSYVATGNRNGLLWIWDAETGEQVTELEAPETDSILSIVYHPSGNLLASLIWTDPGTVYIWDLQTEQIVQEIELGILAGSAKTPFQFSPDGNLMAGYMRQDREDKVRIWEVESQEEVAVLPFENRVNEIDFSPDGSLLAVGSLYLETTIWDVETGTLLVTLDQTIEELTDGTRALAFTRDGGHLAVVRNDGPLEMWRLPGAEPFVEPEIDITQPPPLPSDVLFDTGSAELKAGSDEVLEEFAADLYEALPEAKITFIGHTDSRGDAASNLELSLDRATAVMEWFEAWASENDVDGWELDVDGKGDTELKVEDVESEGNFSEEAGRLNRRVEIEIE